MSRREKGGVANCICGTRSGVVSPTAFAGHVTALPPLELAG